MSQASSPAATGFDEWWVGSYYQQFVRHEGVPLYEGNYIEDLATVPLGDWERRGGKAAYTRLADTENNSLQIVEIPPGGQLKPERHIYDAVMFVLKGRGASTIWQEGEPEQTVEWQEGSLLGIPLNAWHQEFNASGDESCRLVFGTNMAHVMNFYHNADFIFNCPYSFKDRYSYSMEGYFSEEGKHWNLRLFETNFIPDIRKFELDPWPERGVRTSIMRISLPGASVGMHILEVSEGTYCTAHRHGSGALVMIVAGQGYELLYMPGEEYDVEKRVKVAVKPYSVISPSNMQYHQHFNIGKGGFRQLAFRGLTGARFGSGGGRGSQSGYDPVGAARSDDPYGWSYKLTHDKEDPAIRQEYYKELEKNGIHLRLEPVDQ